jgi:hypothetical protein
LDLKKLAGQPAKYCPHHETTRRKTRKQEESTLIVENICLKILRLGLLEPNTIASSFLEKGT